MYRLRQIPPRTVPKPIRNPIRSLLKRQKTAQKIQTRTKHLRIQKVRKRIRQRKTAREARRLTVQNPQKVISPKIMGQKQDKRKNRRIKKMQTLMQIKTTAKIMSKKKIKTA